MGIDNDNGTIAGLAVHGADDARPVASSHGARTELYVQPYIQHGVGEEAERERNRDSNKNATGDESGKSGAKGAGRAAHQACRSRKVRVSGNATSER